MKPNNEKKRFVCAITGASGVLYGKRFVDVISSYGHDIYLTISDSALQVMNHELMLDFDLTSELQVKTALLGENRENLRYYHYKDLTAPVASGSFKTDGMIIIPCSMGTLGRVACGSSTNLIERAADVCLKERRKLVVVPRETPYSGIHIENMLKLSNNGCVVLPASPGFYAGQMSFDDLVDFIVSRALDHLGVENDLMQRYGEESERFREITD